MIERVYGADNPSTSSHPASENAWYVLATIHGEQTGSYVQRSNAGEERVHGMDKALTSQNRRIWNGWYCGHLPENRRAALSEMAGVDIDELRPLTTEETDLVRTVFHGKGMTEPSPDSSISFINAHFAAPLDMAGYIFIHPTHCFRAQFSKSVQLGYAEAPDNIFRHVQAVFLKSVYLNDASFLKSARFVYVRFAEITFFSATSFIGDASFGHAQFAGPVVYGGARFESDSSFHATIFKADARFDGAEFASGIGCDNATFGGDASFKAAKLHGAAFTCTTFGGQVDFREANFSDKVSFESAIFSGDTRFDLVKFRDDVDFAFATFERLAHFSKATFGKIADFSFCQFERQTDFLNAHFLTRFPMLLHAALSSNTAFTAEEEFWPRTAAATAERDRDSIKIIRHAVAKQGLPDEEHFFYRREMASSALIGSWLQRLPYWLFWLISDYGNSLARPTGGLAIVGGIGLLFYGYWLTWLQPTLAEAGAFRTAFGFSFSNVFDFLGFTRLYFGPEFFEALPQTLKVVAAFQAIAGVILLFFLGLGLRNRFRLR